MLADGLQDHILAAGEHSILLNHRFRSIDRDIHPDRGAHTHRAAATGTRTSPCSGGRTCPCRSPRARPGSCPCTSCRRRHLDVSACFNRAGIDTARLDPYVTGSGIHRGAGSRCVLIALDQCLGGIDRHIDRQRPGKADLAGPGTALRVSAEFVACPSRHRGAHLKAIGLNPAVVADYCAVGRYSHIQRDGGANPSARPT